MTALAVAGWGLFLLAAAWLVILGCDYDARCRQLRDAREEVEGLRDQLAAESKVAKHWHGVAMGYHDAPGTRSREPRWRQHGRPVGFHESLAEHTAEAQQRIEGGLSRASESARNSRGGCPMSADLTPSTELLCGCGHPVADHARNRTGACMVRVSDKYDCSCISAWGNDDECASVAECRDPDGCAAPDVCFPRAEGSAR